MSWVFQPIPAAAQQDAPTGGGTPATSGTTPSDDRGRWAKTRFTSAALRQKGG